MSRRVSRRRQVNYKPIFLIGAIAIPVIVIATVLAWPKKQVEVRMEGEPTFDPHLTQHGNFIVRWKTNLPARGNLYYRFDGSQSYDEIVTGQQLSSTVAIPGQAGKTVEFYVEVLGGAKKPLKSKVYHVTLLPPVTTAPATASAPAGRK